MATMPITRVVLYKHGVGYFEGEEDQSVSLAFELRQQVADRLFKLSYNADLQGAGSGPRPSPAIPQAEEAGRRGGSAVRRIEAVVETGIYADDLEQAERFYCDVLGLEPVASEAGRHVFFRVGEASMLLVFRPDSTLKGDHLPAHGSAGQGTSRSGFPPRTSTTGDLTSGDAGYPSSTRSHGRGAATPSISAIPRATPSS